MAEGPPQKLTAKELEGWVPAKLALSQVMDVITSYSTAKHALLRRLTGQQIHSAAESYTHEDESEGIEEKGEVVEIAARFWGSVPYENEVYEMRNLVVFHSTDA